jgi:uncharacterized protein
MNFDKEALEKKAQKAYHENALFFKQLKKRIPPNLDEIVLDLHNEAFSKIDCLQCGNCCRSLGPRITDRDIEKLSKYVKLRPSEFSEKYLRIDEDGDYVFKSMPCPFLGADNYCSVYAERPKACREYPHTDDRKFFQKLDITLENTHTCPVVFEIVEGLKQKIRK